MRTALIGLLCLCGISEGSVRLYNDSPYKLRAVIRGGDGTYLGEMILLPDHFNTWSSNFPSFGPGGQNYSENPSRSMTPYSVQWSCTDGGLYGVCQNVASGAAVIAGSCEGPKWCKPPKKKKKSPYGANEDDEQLHDQDQNSDSSSSE